MGVHVKPGAEVGNTASANRSNPAYFYRAPKWRISLLLAGLIAFLWFSTMTALGNVLGGRSPENAAQLSPTNGFALGRVANTLLRPVEPGAVVGLQYEIADYTRPRRLAIEALMREPTDTRAGGVLSALTVLQGEPVNRLLNDRLLGLGRRAIMPQIIEIDRAARSGESAIVLERIDQLLRVNPGLRESLMPSLVALVADADALPAVEAMLRREPEWRYDFWQTAAQDGPNVINAMRLRERFGPPRDFREQRNDEFLLQALVNGGEWARAEALAARLFTDFDLPRSGNVIRNAGFAREPRLRPFDWRFFADGTISASLQPARGQMIISASGGASGVIASQLVRLDPGAYNFTVKALALPDAAPDAAPGPTRRGGAAKNDALIFALICASDPAVQPLQARLSQAIGGVRVNATGACPYHFLTISLDLPRSVSGSDFVLESIALTPVSAEDQR